MTQTPRSQWVFTATLAALVGVGTAAAEDPTGLRYISRYNTMANWHDHLVGVEMIWDHYALVSSNLNIALIDLNDLTSGGTDGFVSQLTGVDVYSTEMREDGYIFVHLRMGGFAVAYLNPASLTFSLVNTIEEPNVYFGKMVLREDRLYVSAHSYGIRIYDVSNPAAPALVGSLAAGFDDAFAIDVLGDTAYVADGAGGLKVVDISDEGAPVIIAGEDPASASATAEDVMVIGDRVYVASGGAGVGVYPLGGVADRTMYNTPVCAKRLAKVGNHLAVADIGGLEIFAIESDGSLTRVAGESGRRRYAGGGEVTLRLWHGVSAWGQDRLLAANWDSMDVYEIVNPEVDDQPDITPSTDRVRFAPGGGSVIVRLESTGSSTLQISNIFATVPTFTVSPTSAVLERGETLELTIEYAGGQPGSAMVMIESNDPDESSLPIQVYGETEFLDPGEPAAPFTLESWTIDHETKLFVHDTFDLESHAGRIIFFHVFGIG